MKKYIKKGKVFLVGAGPGDPSLITVKGVKCIEKADVIIYDYLASSELLKYANCNAELIYVGKQGGSHTLSQYAINNLIIEKAYSGLVVTRLKGGDPFIFGRGGEEVEVLVNSGIEFEVVPGVTSAIAAAAYAGIPLTHRRYTSDVAFITGHEDPTKESSNIDWFGLGKSTGTLVFFMGVKNLSGIVDKLIHNGRPGDTPTAVIRWGTTPRQTTLTGTLDTIVKKCQNANTRPPAIIVVGKVVNLRKTMKWFDKLPLLGKSIVVTRSRSQASTLVERLSSLGSECIECPTIKILPPNNWSAVDNAIENIAKYKWLIFTSVNAVDFFLKRLFEIGKDIRILGHLKTAVIGPATAKRLRSFGLKSDIIPKAYYGEAVVEAFLEQNIAGSRICLPRAAEARAIIPLELSKMGAIIDEIPVYSTMRSDVGISELLYRLTRETVDMITFTSSSTVKNFKEMLSTKKLDSLLSGITIACIGPITAETAYEFGFKVDIIPQDYTIDGLCESILAYYS